MAKEKQSREALLGEIKKLRSELDVLKNSRFKSKSISEPSYSEDVRRIINFFDAGPDMFFIINPEGLITTVNSFAAQHLGYSKEELVGMPAWSIIHKDDLSYVKSKVSEIIQNKIDQSELEFRKVKKDGSIIYIHERTKLALLENNEINEIIIICRDITDKKDAREKLNSEEERYRTLANNLNVGLYRSTTDKNGHFIEVNPALIKMFGYNNREEFIKLTISDLYVNSKDRIEFHDVILKQGSVRGREMLLKRKEGTHFHASISSVVIADKEGTPLYYDGIVEDITQRKNDEEKIRKKEEQYKSLFNLSPSGITLLDIDGTIIDVNPAYSKLFGYSIKKLIGQNIRILVHPDFKSKVQNNIKKILSGEVLIEVVKSIRKDGSIVYLELYEKKIELPDGKTGILSIANDITERVIIEKKLKKEHKLSEHYLKLFEGVISATPYPIFYKDKDGNYLGCNNAFIEQLGVTVEEITGKKVFEIWPGEDSYRYHQEDMELMKNPEKQMYERDIIDKKGEIRTVIFSKDALYDENGNVAGLVGAYIDITDRIRAEQALIKSEENYRLIVENQTDLVVKVDRDGRFLFVSPSYCKTFGKTEEELLGKLFIPFVHENDREASMKAMEKLLKPPYHIYKEQRAMTKDGWRWLSWIDDAVLDENNNVKEIIGVGRDITERKKTEEAIKQSEKSYKNLFDSTNDAIYVLNKDGQFIDVNKGAENMYGYPHAFFIGKTPVDLSAPGKNDLEDTFKRLKKAFKGEPQQFEFWGLDKSGRIFPKEVKLYPGLYFGKKVIITFAQDITERLKAEKEIRKLSRAIEQSPTIFMVTSLNGNIEYVNPKYSEVTGYTKKEVIGKNPRIFESEKTPQETNIDLWKSITVGKEWHGQLVNRKKNGEEYWESTYVFPLKDNVGNITHFIWIKEDITERKKLEQELISAKEKAEESDRLKSAFLANMSHEIRTPMNAILGFSQLLNDENLNPEDKNQFINLIHSSGNSLMNLINDIIDISRIEAGEFTIHKKKYEIEVILNNLFLEYEQILATEKEKSNIKLVFNNNLKLSNSTINTDVERLNQVFRNLLTNAIKFTLDGSIEFGCNIDQSGFCKFYIKDTGIGIPADKQRLIFESFRQVDETETRNHGGTGLGLAISKKIVEILGGEVWVESEVGKGSVFYFTHPIP